MKNFLKSLRALSCAENFVLVGVFGFLGWLVAKVNNIAVDALWLQLLLGAFLISFTIGAAMMCCVAIKSKNMAAALLVIGAFGLLGLISIEVMVSWAFMYFFGIELAPVIIWYAVPCVLIFFSGFVCLGIEVFKNRKQRHMK